MTKRLCYLASRSYERSALLPWMNSLRLRDLVTLPSPPHTVSTLSAAKPVPSFSPSSYLPGTSNGTYLLCGSCLVFCLRTLWAWRASSAQLGGPLPWQGELLVHWSRYSSILPNPASVPRIASSPACIRGPDYEWYRGQHERCLR